MTKPKRTKEKPAPAPKKKAAAATGKRDPATAVRAAIALGEDSTRQFKRDVTNGDALAAEMVAFANAEGGTLFLGVADDGTAPGLSAQDAKRLNQLVGNTANHAVRSPLTVQTKNVALPNGRVVIVLTVPKGLDKPYFDKNGVIWLKAGADKRRVNSKEELRRVFQISDAELPAPGWRVHRAAHLKVSQDARFTQADGHGADDRQREGPLARRRLDDTDVLEHVGPIARADPAASAVQCAGGDEQLVQRDEVVVIMAGIPSQVARLAQW